MGTSEIEIVPLERSHLESATHIIAEAFVDEPGAVRIIGKSPEKRLPLLRKHFGMQAELSLAQGASRCALLNGELVGVMIISAPGEEAVSGFDMIRLLLRAMFKTSPGILWRGLKSWRRPARAPDRNVRRRRHPDISEHYRPEGPAVLSEERL